MSTRKLLSASSANLLIPISGLLVSPFLSRELGPDGRGLYAALTLPIVVCGWIGTYGLQDALSFHLRENRLTRRGAALVSLVSAVPLGLLGVALLALLGLFVFPGGGTDYRQFLLLACLAPLHILANLLIGALTGAADIRGVNLVKVLPALARTALVVFACLAFELSAFWAGLLFLASVTVGLVAGLARLRSATTEPEPAQPSAGVPIRSLAAYSLACLPGVLAAISSARLDQIIGLPVIGAQQLGYYAVAVSVAEIPMVIATAARTVLMGRPGSDDPRRATRVARLAVLASVVACGLLAAIATVAVPWVFGRPFAPAVLPTIILCLATTLYTCMIIYSAVLLAHGRASRSSAALVAGSVAGVALLLLLAPWGAVGAAVASLGGYGVSVLVAAAAVSRTPETPSLRMLTIPYREDVRLFIDHAAALIQRLAPPRPRPASGAVRPGGRFGTIGVAALIMLAWSRLVVPQLVQLFDSGRPEFNSRENSAPAVADAIGDLLSLAFIGLAAALAVHGLLRNRPPHRLGWLAVLLAPLVAIELSGLVNGELPGPVSAALPLAAVAVWLQRPAPRVLATIGVLGAGTALGSILLALVRPDLGLLSGSAAGAKSGFLGGLLAGPYPHSNVLGLTLALSLPFLFCVGNALLRRAGVLVVLFAASWTGSRTSQLAIVAVLVSYGIIRWLPALTRRLPHSRAADLGGTAESTGAAGGTTWLARWAVAVPVVAGLVLTVAAPLLTRDPAAFSERGRIWAALLDRWAQAPLLGFGPGYFDNQPDLAEALGGQFSHAHNVLVQFLVVGGLLATVLFGVLLYLVWRRSMALLAAGVPAAGLFLVAFTQVSWLEASHLPTTLAGYVGWLPLIIIARLGADLADRPTAEPARTTQPPADVPPVAPAVRTPH
ncbi:O-antigen ligase family protein [Solwaraspora sp. WMMD1047]|uniref:O-antigen ligase family protein n=1 Tax=Solwaraspora sp. WMMD1047 TaxID=3016102 RepID=UPI00241741A5|nr:O-antigen ligase family protein [Solwaraspora sp. WMMD1047]MDG4829852.1 O-antigen ligase family protein [Solwaraspora sp. WMMD1047]